MVWSLARRAVQKRVSQRDDWKSRTISRRARLALEGLEDRCLMAFAPGALDTEWGNGHLFRENLGNKDGKFITDFAARDDFLLAAAAYTEPFLYESGGALMLEAGTEIAFIADAGTNTLTADNHGLSSGSQVGLKNTAGALPGGLTNRQAYFVVNVTEDTFQLALTRGGQPVDITDNGTGTHTAGTPLANPHLGKTILAGQEFGLNDAGWGLARLDANGELDPTFGQPNINFTYGTGVPYIQGRVGRVITHFSGLPGQNEEPYAVAIQRDGKILVAGIINVTRVVFVDPATGAQQIRNGQTWTVVRYNSDGSLDDGSIKDSTPGDMWGDGTFPGQVRTTNFGAAASPEGEPFVILIQPDDKILIGGRGAWRRVVAAAGPPLVSEAVDTDFVIVRYNIDGSLDTTFQGQDVTGGGLVPGMTFASFGGSNGRPGIDGVFGLALQPDGKIIAVGQADAGVLSSTIANNPPVYPGAGLSQAASNVQQNWDVGIARFYPDGAPDETFGNFGKVRMDINTTADTAFSVALQPGETEDDPYKILIGGESITFSGTAPSASFGFAARLFQDGTLDLDFGSLTTNNRGRLADTLFNDLPADANALIRPDSYRPIRLELQQDRKFVLAGTSTQTDINGQVGNSFGLSRYGADGMLDPTFVGSNQPTTITPGQVVYKYRADSLERMVDFDQYADGQFVVAGYSRNLFSLTGNDYMAMKVAGDPPPPVIRFGPAGEENGLANQVLQVTNFVVNERDGIATITIALSEPSTQDISVQYTTLDGTATAGQDYIAANGVVTFQAGEQEATFDIGILNDTLIEMDETVLIRLSNPTGGATIGQPDTAELQIIDDDRPPPPTVNFSGKSSKASEAVVNAKIGVKLSKKYAFDVIVHYMATGGTATGNGVDYTLAEGDLIIPAGQTKANINFLVNNDQIDEFDQTIVVQLSNPMNAVLGKNTVHTYTIQDNDAPPAVQFDAPQFVGVENIANPGPVTASLTLPSEKTVTVKYNVTGGTAVRGQDYNLANGTLNYAPGEITKGIQVELIDNQLNDGQRTINLGLSSPKNASLGPQRNTVFLINDNEAPPTVNFVAAANQGPEGDGVRIPVMLDKTSLGNTQVTYVVESISATLGVDYTVTGGTLTIPAGQTMADLTFGLIDDHLVEGNEQLRVTLTGVVNGVLGGTIVNTYTILDDDTPNPAIIYFSTDINGRVVSSNGAGLDIARQDVVRLTRQANGQFDFRMFFDGSDVGLDQATENIDAFSFLADGSVLISTTGAFSVPRPNGGNLTGSGEDLLHFLPASYGDTTAGTFSLYFDGSDVGLDATNGNIDAVDILPGGDLVLSIAGLRNLPGLPAQVDDEDLVRFTPAAGGLGENTAGAYAFFFVGSTPAIGLGGNENADIDGVTVVAGAGFPTVFFSTRGTVQLPNGTTLENDDIIGINATDQNPVTTGNYHANRVMDGSAFGLTAFDVDAFYVSAANPQAPSSGGFSGGSGGAGGRSGTRGAIRGLAGTLSGTSRSSRMIEGSAAAVTLARESTGNSAQIDEFFARQPSGEESERSLELAAAALGLDSDWWNLS